MIKVLVAIFVFTTVFNAQTFTIYNKSNSNLLSNNVRTIFIDINNTKWFGTEKGLSLLFEDSSWDSLKANDGLASNSITDLASDISRIDSSFIEVATEGGISRLNISTENIVVLPPVTKENSELISNNIRSLFINSNGIYWFGTSSGCSSFDGINWNSFSEENFWLISNDITDIASSRNDYTYLATSSDGVSRIKQDVDGISSASEITHEWSGLASDSVHTVFIDRLGRRWYGTTKGVSMHFGDKSKENWITYNTDDGLIDNNVTAICEDSIGTMWFGTEKGLSSYNGVKWDSYTTDSGLSGNLIFDLEIDENNNIWIATDNGVTFFERSGIKEYIVKKTDVPIEVDGKLDEPQWQNALYTEYLINPTDGSDAKIKTKGKLLWDNENLYIGIIAEDPDVWGTRTVRDSQLWKEEPIEVFCDPDGNLKNYFEIEINPLGTELDILMSKSYSDGGTADFSWDIVGLNSAISVAGTLNDPSDIDTAWYCEMAIPFSALDSRIIGSMSNPPTNGDMWRFNLARYNRMRDRNGNEFANGTEISSWNNMGKPSFHVPERFGKIFFSDELITSVKSEISIAPQKFELIGNYPNPFNPSTKIIFCISEPGFVSLKIYNVLGQEVAILVSKEINRGYYEYQFNKSHGLSSGIYFYKLESNNQVEVKKMLFLK